MTPAEFLASLRSRGVSLSLALSAPSGLRYRAPRGVVTPTVAERIKRAAPVLIPLLKWEQRIECAGIAFPAGLMPATVEEDAACTLPDGNLTCCPALTFRDAWAKARILKDAHSAEWYQTEEGKAVAAILSAITEWFDWYCQGDSDTVKALAAIIAKMER